jgi:hypothetical protein
MLNKIVIIEPFRQPLNCSPDQSLPNNTLLRNNYAPQELSSTTTTFPQLKHLCFSTTNNFSSSFTFEKMILFIRYKVYIHLSRKTKDGKSLLYYFLPEFLYTQEICFLLSKVLSIASCWSRIDQQIAVFIYFCF